jgi:2-haloacid dehalogenase
MQSDPLNAVTTLTFDIFGTVLDLGVSLAEPTGDLLEELGASISAERFWGEWRGRQRIEQYQDSLLMLGHSGYLETCRRALVYCLRSNGIGFDDHHVRGLMGAWQDLRPYQDALDGLERLNGRFRLVALSNGEPEYLRHLADNRIEFDFDHVISVEEAGFFKPHPSVYRTAARLLGAEPHEILMVAAHSFDVMGARAAGFRGAYVNRYGLPFEDTTQYGPDLVVDDFRQLARQLLGA